MYPLMYPKTISGNRLLRFLVRLLNLQNEKFIMKEVQALTENPISYIDHFDSLTKHLSQSPPKSSTPSLHRMQDKRPPFSCMRLHIYESSPGILLNENNEDGFKPVAAEIPYLDDLDLVVLVKKFII